MSLLVFQVLLGGAAALMAIVLGVGLYLVIRDTVRGEGKFGLVSQAPVEAGGVVLHDGIICPECGEPAKEWRVPASANEVLWGGQTCGNCKTSFDKWGKRTSEAPEGSSGASGPPRKVRSTPQPTSRTPSGAPGKPRRWTLNANHGYYVKTGERAEVVELSLSYKDANGAITPVGRFRLDLPALVERDLVTRRGEVYDIKIVRDSGRYFLGVRVSPRVPLADFALSE